MEGIFLKASRNIPSIKLLGLCSHLLKSHWDSQLLMAYKRWKKVLRAYQVPSVIGLKGGYRPKRLFVFHRIGHFPQLAQSTQDILGG